jgi:hypothetical protein
MPEAIEGNSGLLIDRHLGIIGIVVEDGIV